MPALCSSAPVPLSLSLALRKWMGSRIRLLLLELSQDGYIMNTYQKRERARGRTRDMEREREKESGNRECVHIRSLVCQVFADSSHACVRSETKTLRV